MSRAVIRHKLRTGVTSQQEYNDGIQKLVKEWQTRYDATDKGEWTKYTIPDLTQRCAHQFKLYHYTLQFLMGYGDFNEKLHSCKLVQSPNCAVGTAQRQPGTYYYCAQEPGHSERP